MHGILHNETLLDSQGQNAELWLLYSHKSEDPKEEKGSGQKVVALYHVEIQNRLIITFIKVTTPIWCETLTYVFFALQHGIWLHWMWPDCSSCLSVYTAVHLRLARWNPWHSHWTETLFPNMSCGRGWLIHHSVALACAKAGGDGRRSWPPQGPLHQEEHSFHQLQSSLTSHKNGSCTQL